MVRTIARLATIFLSVLILHASDADACSCIQQGPACQSFWTTDAVFDATVDAIGTTTRQEVFGTNTSLTIREQNVKLSVRQAWKGVQPGPLEVVTSESGGSCGYEFKVGQRYLVFASMHRGRWTVSICGLTQPYNGTGEAADFLASLSAPPRGGRVFGSVKRQERVFEFDRQSPERPVQTTVRLSGGGQERSVPSTDGRFEFTGLQPGPYHLDLELPSGYSTYATRRDVQVPDPRACAREDYSLSPAGRITGQAVGPEGKPLVGVKVDLTAADARAHPTYGLSTASATTDGDGRFEIPALPPGKYVVGVNLGDLPNKYNPYARTLYPSDGSDAAVIDLSLGQTHDLGTWRMPPPLPVVRVEGIVTWQDGTPAAGIHVTAWDRTGNPSQFARGAGNAKTGADGRFVIELRQGRVYTFGAVESDSQPAILAVAAPRIETTGPVGPVRIVIRGDRQPGRSSHNRH